ncbi:MAG: ROK family protein [Spirochaetota bacterium]
MTIAAVEAGGTKFVLGLLRSEGNHPEILWRDSILTTEPIETLGRAAALLAEAAESHGRIEGLGIGCFGPIELRPDHPAWGRVTSTPKALWQGADVAGVLGRRLGLKAAFDTDVNAAAAGEGRWGAGRGLSDFIYLTVGTGIGGGIVSGGRLVHGTAHPELGHSRIAREEGDGFAGVCPYHGDCVEGLASGPAIALRWGKPAWELPPDHPAWELEAHYLARAMAAWVCAFTPRRILMGGGVGMRPGLAERVQELLEAELAGYFGYLVEGGIREGFVRRPELGDNAGLFGAAALALGADEGV